MKRRPFESRFPLLSKELIEEAQRPRTYLFRVAYAAVIFAVSLFFLYGLVSRGGEVEVASLARGNGVRLFNLVFWAQAAGIILLLPAMMADAITRERERNCLDLLVLTDLSPWDIIFQKLLSRCVPMATCLTLSLPLLAVSMAYGGVTADMVWSGAYVLLLFCLQVGAVSLYLSADSSNASSALLTCYVILPLHGLLLGGVGLYLGGIATGMTWEEVGVLSGAARIGLLVPPLLLVGGRAPPLYQTLYLTFPAVVSVYLYLLAAHARLQRVAFNNPREPVEASFKLAEVPVRRAHRAGGANSLPLAEPVAWRELSSELMAQIKKVFLVAVCLNFPLLLLISGIIEFSPEDGVSGPTTALPYLVGALLLLAAGTISLMAASTFARERAGQTLDVLLTTPLPTERILGEKLAAAKRCALMASVPLGIVFIVEELIELARPRGPGALLYLACSGLSLAVYLPLAIALGAWIGLRVRNRGRAILAVLGSLAAWVFAVPEVVRMALELGGQKSAAIHGLYYLYLLSPVTIVQLNETKSWNDFAGEPAWVIVTLNFALYCCLLLWLRRRIIRDADRLLGRIPEPKAR